MAVPPSGLKYFLCGLMVASPIDSGTAECLGEGRSKDTPRSRQCSVVLSGYSGDQLINFDFGLSGVVLDIKPYFV